MMHHNYVVCDMQDDCGENTDCVEDGLNYRCVCKNGFMLEDDKCIGMKN